jgi:AcrR family transcriptional regulator
MAMIEQLPVTDSISATILAAAMRRFEQFGYSKTTMAEIAADCDMSAANIYRYFENKLEIGAQLARRCLAEECAALKEVIESDASASSRLEGFLLANLRYTYQRWSEQPRINELVEAIARDRTDVVQDHIQFKQELIMRLIEAGNSNGEFAGADPVRTAEAILVAGTVFDVPLFMHLHPLEKFEEMARNVAELILRGLAARTTQLHSAP